MILSRSVYFTQVAE